MYLHIGLNYMIKKSDIVGIFDIETTTGSTITKQFLMKAQKKNRVITVTDDLPRSYIVCRDGNREYVYLTSLSTSTLIKRKESKESLFSQI